MVDVKVTLNDPQSTGLQWTGDNNRGNTITIDTPQGGTGPKPTELVAMGLAACTAFDVIGILRKKRQQVTNYEVKVEGDQADGQQPAVFTAFRIRHIVTGYNVDAKAVEDAIHLSETKYCSVGATLAKAASVTTSFEVIEAGLSASSTKA
jgi:putative redox protein